jgi:hypothetical protein
VTEVVRLTFVSHAMTDAMAADGVPPMNHSTRPAVGRSTARSISESEAVQANPAAPR